MITKALSAVLGVVLLLLALQTLRLHDAQLELRESEVQTLVAITQAAEQARAEERHNVLIAQEKADEARKREVQALADAERAGAAAERLRAALAAARGAACRAPTPAAPGEAADPTEGVLADVQRRLDDATDRVARFADQAHIAGAACEALYQSLSGPVKSAQP